jgi:hypothetical protein
MRFLPPILLVFGLVGCATAGTEYRETGSRYVETGPGKGSLVPFSVTVRSSLPANLEKAGKVSAGPEGAIIGNVGTWKPLESGFKFAILAALLAAGAIFALYYGQTAIAAALGAAGAVPLAAHYILPEIAEGMKYAIAGGGLILAALWGIAKWKQDATNTSSGLVSAAKLWCEGKLEEAGAILRQVWGEWDAAIRAAKQSGIKPPEG